MQACTRPGQLAVHTRVAWRAECTHTPIPGYSHSAPSLAALRRDDTTAAQYLKPQLGEGLTAGPRETYLRFSGGGDHSNALLPARESV